MVVFSDFPLWYDCIHRETRLYSFNRMVASICLSTDLRYGSLSSCPQTTLFAVPRRLPRVTVMTEREQLELAITALESQRAILGDAIVNAALAPMREKLAALSAQPANTEQQRKQVTVLFADVSGFTAMSETMDPEEVSATMNALWRRLDAAITGHGGTIDKHIGDALMALFGAPTAHENDPERAIRAALAMQDELRDFNIIAELAVPLRMRIGINTG